MTRGEWLRTNRWFLVALIVLIPAAFVVSLITRYFPYLETQPQLESVAFGDVVRYAGTDFQLTDLEVLDGDAFNAPAGADVVVATLSVDVIEPPEFSVCDITLFSDETGVEREWWSTYSTGDYRVPDYFEESCDLTEVGRYHLQVTFLVPRGEVVDPEVQVKVWDEEPRVLRLS